MSSGILLRHVDVPDLNRLEVYERLGGYAGLRRALTEMTPDQVLKELEASGLRGRGGAGFSMGKKASFLPHGDIQKYLCCNADESEPGTFKDRILMEEDPHRTIEGMIIAAYAVGASRGYIYVRGEYPYAFKIMSEAVAEACLAGVLGGNILGAGLAFDIEMRLGAGAYICGEETGLLESLEGKKGWPRLKPPFPATSGLYGCPTCVNNVETLAAVVPILQKGGDWYASLGTPKNAGTRLFCVSGHVKKPGTYELPMGIPLRSIIYDYAGGIKDDRKLKAVIPGGSSVPILTADQIDVKMDFDSVAAIGSLLGSGGVVVMNEDTCMVKALLRITKFYAHESCGQCTPCREGTTWLKKTLQRVYDGDASQADLDQMMSIAFNMMGTTICPLADAAAMPVRSYIQKFRHEFEYHVRHKCCDVEAAVSV
jgi:NADH-quinone oxidoreductase subunit F